MLELYHNINSVCAQKVRVALAEKELAYQEHLIDLRGGQFDPAYMKLNPNAVVPTLVHDGKPVIESSVILYYLDEAFPQVSLMPSDPHLRARVRQFNKLIDEYVHNSCTILTFATAFRPWFAGLTGEQVEARLAKSPSKQRTEYKRDVALHGLESRYAKDALGYHLKMLAWMEAALAEGLWLAGKAFSLADAAVIPYILRLDLLKLDKLLKPAVKEWYARMRARASVKKELLDRMTPEDHAPFKALGEKWPKIQTLLEEVA